MVVHDLINYLLKLGEELTEGEPCRLQTNERVRHHEMAINAVMIAIKPGILDIMFTKFDKAMIKKYLMKVKASVFHVSTN